MRGKIFTRDEADRMVPLIKRIVVSARALQRLILRKQGEAGRQGRQQSDQDARLLLLAASRRLREELKKCIEELATLGCFLRDPETGVVECYGELNGQIVYFTWMPGSSQFECWHPLETSYVNRQPLPGFTRPTAAKEAGE